MARKRIQEYKFTPGISYIGNLYPNAYSLITRNRTFLIAEMRAFLQNKVAEGSGDWAGYTYNSEKCDRDVGYVLDAWEKDLRYGGNERTYKVAQKYWDSDTPQVDGSRTPEIETHTFLRNLITTNILTNSVQGSPQQGAIPQVQDSTITSETGADTRITTLANIVINVITTGLSELPTLVYNGYSRIKVPQRIQEEELLLITNITTGTQLYNFNDPSKLASVEYTYLDRNKRDFTHIDEEHDPDFVNYLQNADYISDIGLYADTQTMSSTDNLQIFMDTPEQQVRPFDFGTDAIERNRVANPLSMLDADFEYGLQPTKWQAIAAMRGYPSVYEIPGTEINVSNIETDASAGTGGVGQSKITVTTLGPHGFNIGTPVTVRGLEPSIVGAQRAEGSFIIVNVPTDTTFEYYAKAKVGTANPQSLYTPYIQMRQGGFYTGANISDSPTFAVLSNGSSGTFTLALAVASGETRLPFTGTAPELGAPLDDVGAAFIPSGSQVTGVVGDGNDPFSTINVEGDTPSGSTSLNVSSASGLAVGMAIDDNGSANFITQINSNVLSLSDPTQQSYAGDNVDYLQREGSNVAPQGADATFDVTLNNGNYTVALNTAGTNYQIGDYLIIKGSSVGGEDTTHDIEIRVTDSNTAGNIITFVDSGTGFDGVASFFNVGGTTQGGNGSGGSFIVTKAAGGYSAQVFSPNVAVDYRSGDRILIQGSQLGGVDGTHDCIITVGSVDSFGTILTVSASGVSTSANITYTGLAYTTSGNGLNAGIDVLKDATTYTVTIQDGGINFAALDTITISGSNLGGSDPTNNLTITVDAVDVNGSITAFTASGTGLDSQDYEAIGGSNLVGNGVLFNITTSGGAYTVAGIVDAGQDFAIGDEIVIPGSDLGGQSPLNDLTVTVDAIDSIGGVATASAGGVAKDGNGSFINVSGQNEAPVGGGGSFDINRNLGVYTVGLSTPGANYKVGNRILFQGTAIGGDSPAHDLIVTVDTVDGSGGISTFTSSGTAQTGSQLSVYSVVTMSESTTDALPQGGSVNFDALATIEVTFPSPHGVVPGSTFIVSISSGDADAGGTNNHELAAGSFIATAIPSLDKLSYQARAVGTIETTAQIQGTIYPRPDSFFVHRPFDGGVQLGTGSPVHGAQAIRQSKKYIRYQSGKGIMYTTGALFAPSYDLLSITADGTAVGSEITVTTDDVDHGLQVGATIRIVGIETPGYNGNYTVEEIVSERVFIIRAKYILGSTTATLSDNPQVQTRNWHGAKVLAGTYDEQNGIFFEYNGKHLYCVQRSATFQLSGTIAINKDQNEVSGTNTRFLDQLSVGDRVVIRGMTHVVSKVNSQSSMNVTPDFRGIGAISGAKMAKVKDKKARQDTWNRDKCDGTGKSGYNLDISYMQMIGIQYSWYGAGFIDWMFRGSDGNFIMAHRMRNSNINTEAYMRTGNQPVRYEVINESAIGKLKSNIDANVTEIELEDASDFPDEGGVIYLDNELISFTGINGNTLTNCTRQASMVQYASGATRTYTAGPKTSHSAKTGLVLVSNTTTPIIQHWGSSFITDGGFDSDRGYLFSYASTGVAVTTTKATSFLIRLAPSVSNAIVGDLGERELLNRAQLLLDGLEITSDTSTGGIVVQGILNPQNYPTNPDDVGWTGLSGLAQGGQPSFAQIAPGGGINWNSGAQVVTASATSQGSLTRGITLQQTYPFSSNEYYRAVSRRRDWVAILESDYQSFSADIQQGLPITGAGISSGTTISSIQSNAITYYSGGPQIRILYLSARPGTSSAQNQTVAATLTKTFKTAPTNNIYFQKASWEASGATTGTEVDISETRFPAGTAVQSVTLESYGGTEYYDVTFSQTSDPSTITAGTTTITFNFTAPPYAQPGETIFSFIANPGERSTLDLSFIKELTNTTLGGRGTFPNGPDVLAINVFKTSGSDTTGNIILRWSEAQA